MKDLILSKISPLKDLILSLPLVSALINTILAVVTYVKDHGIKNLKNAGRTYLYFLTILLILMIWGLFSWIRIMLLDGVGITGASDFVPWGVYMVIHAFGRKDYGPLATRAILVGVLALVAALLCLVSDVGIPTRASLLPGVLRSYSSALVYSSTSYGVYIALLLSQLFFALKITLMGGVGGHWDKKMAKLLAIAALIVALVGVQGIEGSIFAIQKARGFWNTPLMPPHFVVLSLVSGTAFMIFIAILTAKITKRELVSKETLAHMGGLLAFLLGIVLFMDLFEHIISAYAAKPVSLEVEHALTTRFAPFFLINTIGMFSAMVILLFKRGRSITGLLITSSMTLIAIIAYRWDLIIVAQVPPLFPGIGEIEYIPTLPEMAVVYGITALAIFLYLVLTKVLPMEKTYQGDLVSDD
jgi:molybdopterin-containing oxidoreductase family membrane subunit